jgi:hypothetical protein
MSANKKVYAVILQDSAAIELGKIVETSLKSSDFGDYIYAQKIDSNGNYFHMWLEHLNPSGTSIEIELQIPHRHIKAVFYAADVREIGFT